MECIDPRIQCLLEVTRCGAVFDLANDVDPSGERRQEGWHDEPGVCTRLPGELDRHGERIGRFIDRQGSIISVLWIGGARIHVLVEM
ncbi:hypothetical protein ASF08_08955 [Methylobacterium sp. Leaf85]|nr:hypothetical protein ASF08_08955 [Methylobacterium sp. Leaf85]